MRDSRGDVDFEISFSALLATIAVYISSSSIAYEPMVEVSAIGLLLLTLIRRIGYMNGLSIRHPIFPLTTYVMSSISYIVCVYILYCIAEVAIVPIGSVNTLHSFLIISITLPILVLTLQEVTIGGFMGETQRIFETASSENEGTFGEFIWGQFAKVSREGRVDQPEYTVQKKLSEFSKSKSFSEATPEQRRAVYSHLVGGIIGLILPFVVYGGISLLLGYILQVSLFLSFSIAISVLMITGPIDIWLSGYGLVPINQTAWLYKSLAAAVAIVLSFVILPLGS